MSEKRPIDDNPGTMKVYRLNDFDWWAGENLEDVKAAYVRECGLDESTAFDFEYPPYELSERQMKETEWIDVDGVFTGEEGRRITFAEALRLALETGYASGLEPVFFASTEY